MQETLGLVQTIYFYNYISPYLPGSSGWSQAIYRLQPVYRLHMVRRLHNAPWLHNILRPQLCSRVGGSMRLHLQARLHPVSPLTGQALPLQGGQVRGVDPLADPRHQVLGVHPLVDPRPGQIHCIFLAPKGKEQPHRHLGNVLFIGIVHKS